MKLIDPELLKRFEPKLTQIGLLHLGDELRPLGFQGDGFKGEGLKVPEMFAGEGMPIDGLPAKTILLLLFCIIAASCTKFTSHAADYIAAPCLSPARWCPSYHTPNTELSQLRHIPRFNHRAQNALIYLLVGSFVSSAAPVSERLLSLLLHAP